MKRIVLSAFSCAGHLAACLVAVALGSVAFSPLQAQMITGTSHTAEHRQVVNFTELASQLPLNLNSNQPSQRSLPKPAIASPSAEPTLQLEAPPDPELNVNSPSPSPGPNFLGLFDNNTRIPPDTQGAVGPNHVMVTLNTGVRVLNRDGVVIQTVSLDQFWATVGGNPVCFDPHIRYDPYGKRWIFSAGANPLSTQSALLVGVSETSDPTGNWFLFETAADSTGQRWADYPQVGFNKNWIVVTANMFPISGTGAVYVNVYAFNKTDLYTNGQGAFTLLQNTSGTDFSMCPAETLDPLIDTLYLVQEWSSSAGALRVCTITGSPGSELLTFGTGFPVASTWSAPTATEILPQLGITNTVDQGDSRVLNTVYRNGRLWAAQTVRLLAFRTPQRTAVQWWQFIPSGIVLQFGRIDDPTATNSYAYPCIAVNKNDDALIGYSHFSSTQYISANYAFRFANDPPGRMRADTVLKAGEGPYYKTYGSGENRWGDFSSTVVDPVNDVSMWTFQEYAATPAGDPSVDGSGNWAVWVGKIDPGPNIVIDSMRLASESYAPTNGAVDPGETVTFEVVLKNAGLQPSTNLTAALQPGAQLVFPSSPQYYGAIQSGTLATQYFTCTVVGNCGDSIPAIFTITDDKAGTANLTNSIQLGTFNVVIKEEFDNKTPPLLPSGWFQISSGSGQWGTSPTVYSSPPNSVFAPAVGTIADEWLFTPIVRVTNATPQLTFRHWYNFPVSPLFALDGGALEISINRQPFADILAAGGSFVTNGYNSIISTLFGNPLSGRNVWSKSSGGWITTVVNLPSSNAVREVEFRWRLGCDSSGASAGWYIDSVLLTDGVQCSAGPFTPTLLASQAAAGNFSFNFASVSGQSYTIEYQDQLTNTNTWTTLQTMVGDGTIKTITDALVPQRYYRVRSP